MSRQRRSEETRIHILRAAAESIREFGYDATGVAEICHRAGLSKGAFYYHFPSKLAVFLALRDQWIASLDAKLVEVRQGGGTILSQLQRMAEMAAWVLRVSDDQLPIFLEFWNKAGREPEFRQSVLVSFQRYKEFFRVMIEEGIKDGSLKNVDPRVTAHIVVSLAFGFFLQGLLDPKGMNWSELSEKGMQTVLQSFAAS